MNFARCYDSSVSRESRTGKSHLQNPVEFPACRAHRWPMAKKASPAQLAARKKFAAMAKERAKAAKSGGSKSSAASKKKSNIGKSKRPAAIKENPKKPMSMRTFKLKKARPLKTRASRRYVSGPPSNQDDVSKVTVRTPNLVLAPIDESKFEIDLNGSFSKLGF